MNDVSLYLYIAAQEKKTCAGLMSMISAHSSALTNSSPSGSSPGRGDERARHPEAGPSHLGGAGDAGRGGEGLRQRAGGLPCPAGPVPEHDCQPEAVHPGL